MTQEAWTPSPEYTVAGIGPYTITHPYETGAISVAVRVGDDLQALNTSEFSVSPETSMIEGNLFLTPAAAATHDGRKLIIDRVTPDEQGWLAVQGERELGLMLQLDRMTQAIQELRASVGGAIRIRGALASFDWQDGTVPMLDGDRVISGPSATEIASAEAQAIIATAAAVAAAASAAEALAKQNSMLRRRGPWVTATAYAPSDIVRESGSAYICLIAHTSGTFATDFAATRWEVFVQKGDAGAGTGDMLKTENLSGLANVSTARTNLGLAALATKALAAFADIAPAAVRTGLETIALDETDEDELTTVKAVADFVRGLILPVTPLASWDWSTNVSSIPLPGLAGWDSVVLTGVLVASDSPLLQVSADNGVSWRTSNYITRVADEGGSNNLTNGWEISRIGVGTARFDFTLQHMSQLLATHGSGQSHHSNPRAARSVGDHNVEEVVNAIRLTGATFTDGYLRVYGLRRAAP